MEYRNSEIQEIDKQISKLDKDIRRYDRVGRLRYFLYPLPFIGVALTVATEARSLQSYIVGGLTITSMLLAFYAGLNAMAVAASRVKKLKLENELSELMRYR